MKPVRYFLEALCVYLLYGFFYILPVKSASGFGGWVGRTIGPRLASSRKARRHLEQSLPGKSETEYQKIITDMWENLGRVIAEYPHLHKIATEHTELVNSDILVRIRDSDKPGIFFTGHLANWEVVPSSCFLQYGLSTNLIYREPNNPWVKGLLDNARSLKGRMKTIAKSRSGTRDIVKAIRDKQHIGILIDQKYNEGIPALFFGRPAMTSTAFVDMALKYECPLVPIRIERLENVKFRLTFEEPIELTDKDGNPLPVDILVGKAHKYLEEWISDRPDQWIWLHKRWSEKAEELYKNRKVEYGKI